MVGTVSVAVVCLGAIAWRAPQVVALVRATRPDYVHMLAPPKQSGFRWSCSSAAALSMCALPDAERPSPAARRPKGRGRGRSSPPSRRVMRDGRGMPIEERGRGRRRGRSRGGGSPTEKPVPGQEVAVLQKMHYKTGERTVGVVEDVLTRSSEHHRGFKVRLTTGVIGRTIEILSEVPAGARGSGDGGAMPNAQVDGTTAADILAMPLDDIAPRWRIPKPDE
jgi:uncharacterized repeat protein (TIGR03833 family)